MFYQWSYNEMIFCKEPKNFKESKHARNGSLIQLGKDQASSSCLQTVDKSFIDPLIVRILRNGVVFIR